MIAITAILLVFCSLVIGVNIGIWIVRRGPFKRVLAANASLLDTNRQLQKVAWAQTRPQNPALACDWETYRTVPDAARNKPACPKCGNENIGTAGVI